jgi:spermidine synthase
MAVFVRFFLSALVLLPITLCLGAIFPVVVKVCTRDLEAVGRSVGMLYSANTVGAICGAFLAGFCVVPMFGAEKALVYASAVNLMIAIGLLLCLPSVSKPAKMAGSLIGVCAMSVMIAQPEVWDRLVLLAAQKERRILAVRKHYMADDMSYKDWHDTLANANKVLFWKDGTCANVGVLGYSWLPQRSLLTNGHVDASHFDKKNNLLLATYPLMFRPDAKDICVIGWGSGISVGAAGLLPNATVEAIEIEPGVIEAARFFNDVNFVPDKNPRVKLELNDGRNYLLAIDKKFDVLISEPSNPWQAGVCNLFTKEYFKICHDRVKPGGIFAAWVQMDEVEKKYVLHVLSALQSQFKYTMPIIADRGNLMVMASDEPIKLNYDQVQQVVQHSPLTPAFKMADVTSADDVLASLAATPEGVKRLTQGMEPNSDDRNKLEYEVSKTYETEIFSAKNAIFFQENGGDFWNSVDWGKRDAAQKALVYADVGSRASALGEPAKAYRWAKESFGLKPNAEALRVEGVSQIEMGNQDGGIALLCQALAMDPNHIPTLQTRGMVAMASGRLDLARIDFNKVLAVQPGNKVALLHLAQTYLPEYNRVSPPGEANQAEPALAILRNLAKDKDFSDKHPDVYRLAGLAAMRVGSLKDAEESLAKYVSIKGDDGDSWRALACIQYGRGNTTRGAFAWDKSLALSRIPSADLVNKARNFLTENKQEAAIMSLSRALELNPANREAILMLRSMATTNAKASDCLARLKVI